MLAGFFPLDGATGADWRFVRVCHAVVQGQSLTRTVFSFYNRPCPLTDEAVHLIDGMLSINPALRFTVPEVLAHSWLSRTRKPPQPEVLVQENMPWAAEQPAKRLPEYRHATFAPAGAEMVGLGLQVSMELEAYSMAAVAEAKWREARAYAQPVYRGNFADFASLCVVDDGPRSAEEAGPPLPLQRQRGFLGALPR